MGSSHVSNDTESRRRSALDMRTHTDTCEHHQVLDPEAEDCGGFLRLPWVLVPSSGECLFVVGVNSRSYGPAVSWFKALHTIA